MRAWFAVSTILVMACQLTRAQSDDVVLPVGFAVSTFASGFASPTSLAFAPDGRLFVAEKEGDLFVVSKDGSSVTPLTHIDVYAQSECGLIGMAIDPSFPENHYIYVFATVTSDTQQIIRITEGDGTATNHTVVRDNLPTSGQVHNGGGLRVGPDDKLYFSIGDTGIRELSQQMNTFAGKVCRINLDGSTPDDNPFVTPTGTPRAVYALGFRNPFRFCFAPDGRLLVMDVGSNGDARREEVNLVRAGENFGWPAVEGLANAPPGEDYVDPIIAYHAEGSAIAGCVVYHGTRFPEEYHGDLFHLDYTSHKLFRVKLPGDSVERYELFHQAANGPVDLAEGPDGALYYAELFTGDIQQIRFGPPPDAIVNPDPPDVMESDDAAVPDSESNNDVSSGAIDPSPPCGAGMMLASCLALMGLMAFRFVHTSRRATSTFFAAR